jgi:hypothetical protein
MFTHWRHPRHRGSACGAGPDEQVTSSFEWLTCERCEELFSRWLPPGGIPSLGQTRRGLIAAGRPVPVELAREKAGE